MNEQIKELLDKKYRIMYDEFLKIVKPETHKLSIDDNNDLIVDTGNGFINFTTIRQKHARTKDLDQFREHVSKFFQVSSQGIDKLLFDDGYVSLRPILPSYLQKNINKVDELSKKSISELKYGFILKEIDGITHAGFFEKTSARLLLNRSYLKEFSKDPETWFFDELEDHYLNNDFILSVDKINMIDDIPLEKVIINMMKKDNIISPAIAMVLSSLSDAGISNEKKIFPERGLRIIGEGAVELLLNPDTRLSVCEQIDISKYISGEKLYLFPVTQDIALIIPEGVLGDVNMEFVSKTFVAIWSKIMDQDVPSHDRLYNEYDPIVFEIEGTGKYQVNIVFD